MSLIILLINLRAELTGFNKKRIGYGKKKFVCTDMLTFLFAHMPVMIKKINEQGKKEIYLIQLKSGHFEITLRKGMKKMRVL